MEPLHALLAMRELSQHHLDLKLAPNVTQDGILIRMRRIAVAVDSESSQYRQDLRHALCAFRAITTTRCRHSHANSVHLERTLKFPDLIIVLHVAQGQSQTLGEQPIARLAVLDGHLWLMILFVILAVLEVGVMQGRLLAFLAIRELSV